MTRKTTICLVFLFVATCHCFFLQSRELRKMLRFFPKAFEVENNHRTRPVHSPHRENEYHYNDDYDRHDADNRRNTIRNSKGRLNGRYDHKHVYTNKDREVHYHSGPHCDHPDHYNQPPGRYQEERPEKHHQKNSNEEMSDYNYSRNDRRNYEDRKQLSAQGEKEYEEASYDKETVDKKGYYNKDYITGILVTIPKIKGNGNGDLSTYFKDNKKPNVFLQQLLKTEEDDHQIPDDDIKSFY